MLQENNDENDQILIDQLKSENSEISDEAKKFWSEIREIRNEYLKARQQPEVFPGEFNVKDSQLKSRIILLHMNSATNETYKSGTYSGKNLRYRSKILDKFRTKPLEEFVEFVNKIDLQVSF